MQIKIYNLNILLYHEISTVKCLYNVMFGGHRNGPYMLRVNNSIKGHFYKGIIGK